MSGSLGFIQLESHPIDRFFELQVFLLLYLEVGVGLPSNRQVLLESLDFVLECFNLSIELTSVKFKK